MDDSAESWADKILELPPVAFYTGLIVLGIGIIWWSYPGDDEADNVQRLTGLAARQPLQDTPEPLKERPDPLEQLYQTVPPTNVVGSEMNVVLNQLAEMVARAAERKENRVPSWLKVDFRGEGIDSESAKERFAKQQVVVKRWQASETAPKFAGGPGFLAFLRNVSQMHSGCDDVRVEFKIYAAELEAAESAQQAEIMNVRLVAESYAARNLGFDQIAELGYRNQSGQSTSIWVTQWQRQKRTQNRKTEYQLISAKVLAEEQITMTLNARQLLVDSAASILAGTEAAEQFSFGIDQWSRKIPGLDVQGQHGVAVGDVNNDGLEDLYVCQGHGLPNRLLLQNGDGTAKDISHESGTNLLDQTRSALLIDIENDGDQDLIVATDEALVVLSNNGSAVFQIERCISVGRNAQSITAADFDLDGDLDIFLCKYEDINRQADILMFPTDMKRAADGGRNVLLRNDEGFNFVDVTDVSGFTDFNHRYSRSASWYDYDQDGDADLYVANEFSNDQFFENQDGYFSDISGDVGVGEIARHKSASVGDFNQDGYEDIFVTTDVPLAGYRVLQGLKNELNQSQQRVRQDLANQPKETSAFRKISSGPRRKAKQLQTQIDLNQAMLSESQVRYKVLNNPFQAYFLRAPIFNSESAFGSVAADINNDGFDDLLITNGGLTRSSEKDLDEVFYVHAFGLDESTPYKNTSVSDVLDPNFRINRVAHEIGDLCRAGYSLSSRQRNRCYFNIGPTGFANASAVSGLDLPDDARAIATTDWDQDGDLDVVVTCRNAPQLRMFINHLDRSESSVSFELEGTTSNRDAIGARVELYMGGRLAPMVKTIQAGSGHLAQSSKRILFGVDPKTKIEKVVVFWPSGSSQTFSGITAGANYKVVEGESKLAESINDRFNVVVRGSSLPSKVTIPNPEKRSLFYPRPYLPTIQAQLSEDKWCDVTTDDKPMFILFWSRDSASDDWLRELKQAKRELEEVGVDTLAVFIDEDAQTDAQWRYARQAAASIEYEGDLGTLAPSSLDQLRFIFADWFNDRNLSQLPFGLLLDQEQRACAFYTTESFDVEQFQRDVKLSKQNGLQYRLSVRTQYGFWACDTREAKVNRLRVRMIEAGYEKAADELDQASSRQRAHELTQKAIEVGARGDYPRAQVFFQKAIDLNPRCVPAFIGEADLLSQLAKDQSNDEALRFEMLLRASKNYEAALAINPVNLDAILGRAQVAVQQNRRAEALSQLMTFLEIDPDRYEVHAMVGRLLFQEKKYDTAAFHLAKAFDNRPNLPFLAGDLGYLYLVSGDDSYARKFLRLANRLQPSDRNIQRLLAEAELVTGNFDEAVKQFAEVNRRDPTHRRSKNVLAWLLATCPYENQRDGEKAKGLISPIVELVGDKSPSVLEIYAASFAETGDFDRAVELQEKAIEIVESRSASEAYSAGQHKGMMARLQLYQRKRPYRTADISQIPIPRPQRLD